MADVTFVIELQSNGDVVLRNLKAQAGQIGDAVKTSADRAAQSLGTLENQATSLSQTLSQFARGALLGLGAEEAARMVLQYADTASLLEGRLKLVTSSAQELATAQQTLFTIAQNTRQSYEATVEVYSRTARAQDQLGISGSKLFDLTEALNLAVKVSGATGEAAAGGMLQLSQAFQSGVLQGDEFRSVSETLPNILTLVAKEMGVTRAELKQLGSEGKITGEILARALTNNLTQLREEAGKLPTTLGQSLTVLSNSVLKFIGDLNEATGATSEMGKVILLVADNMDTLALALGVFSTLTIVSNIGAITKALMGLSSVIGAMQIGAFLLTPMGLLTLALAAAAAGAYAFGKSLRSDEVNTFAQSLQALNTVQDASTITWHQVGDAMFQGAAAIVELTDKTEAYGPAAAAAATAASDLAKELDKQHKSAQQALDDLSLQVAIFETAVAKHKTLTQATKDYNNEKKRSHYDTLSDVTAYDTLSAELEKHKTVLKGTEDAQKKAAAEVKKHAEETKRLAEAKEKAHARLVQDNEILTQQNVILAQVKAGTLSYEAGLARLAATTDRVKVKDDQLSDANAKLTETNKFLKESIEEARKRWEAFIEAQDKGRDAISDTLTELDNQTAALKVQAAEIQKGIAQGLTWEQVQRNIASATIDAKVASGEFNQEQERSARAMQNAQNAAEDLKTKYDHLKDSALLSTEDLRDAFSQVVTGVLEGSGKAEQAIENFGKGLGLKLIEGIAFGKKGLENNVLIPNFSDIFGPNGIVGSIFGQGGQASGQSFISGVVSQVQGFFGSGGGGGGQFANVIAGGSSTAATAGQSAGTVFGQSFATALAGYAVGEGARKFLDIGQSVAGNIGAGIGSSIGAITGAIGASMLGLPPQLGSAIGSFFGNILGGLFGGLFAHKPTAGTVIRKGVKDWLKDIGVSFAEEIDSGDYFFNETKALAKKMFGGDFLAASKAILTDRAGPELAKQLQALGTFVTGEAARQAGKPIEQAGTTFGNMLVDNLGIENIPNAINEIIDQAGITLPDLTEKLTQYFKAGEIGADFYRDAIAGAVSIFSTDLPEAINVASLAQQSFTADGVFDLETFQKKLKETVSTYDVISKAATDAILNSADGEDAAEQFGKGLKKGLTQLALDLAIQKFLSETLFAGIDLSDGLSQAEIDTLKSRIKTFRDSVDDLHDSLSETDTAADDAGDGLDGVGDSADDTATKAQALTDKIIQLNAHLRQLAQQEIDIKVNYIERQIDIGVLTPKQGTSALIGLKYAELTGYLESGGLSPIATEQPPALGQEHPDLSHLSDEALAGVVTSAGELADLVVKQFNERKAAIEAGLADEIDKLKKAEAEKIDLINQWLASTIDAINKEEKATEDAIHKEYEEKRKAIQGTIDQLNKQKDIEQDIYQKRLDGLQEELRTAQTFQQLAQSITGTIRSLVVSQASPLSPTEQLAFLQRQAQDVRAKIATSTGPEKAARMQELAGLLQQQAPFFDRLTTEGNTQFTNVVNELEQLRTSAEVQGNTAEEIQARIDETTQEMNATMASIDSQIESQQQLLSDLSEQETTDINAAQAAAAEKIKTAQEAAAEKIAKVQRDTATQIQDATDRATAKIETLRGEASQKLTDLYNLQQAAIEEQRTRDIAARDQANKDLGDIKSNTAYLQQIAADNLANYGTMQALNAGINALNTFLTTVPQMARGGYVKKNQFTLLHGGEWVVPEEHLKSLEVYSAQPVGTGPRQNGGTHYNIQVDVPLSHNSTIHYEGSGDPETDGLRLGRAEYQALLYELHHGEFGEEIVRHVQRAIPS